MDEMEKASKTIKGTASNSMNRSTGIYNNANLDIAGLGPLTDRKFASTNSAFIGRSTVNGSSSMSPTMVTYISLFIWLQMMSQSQGHMQSAMLEKEKKELEKIKFR